MAGLSITMPNSLLPALTRSVQPMVSSGLILLASDFCSGSQQAAVPNEPSTSDRIPTGSLPSNSSKAVQFLGCLPRPAWRWHSPHAHPTSWQPWFSQLTRSATHVASATYEATDQQGLCELLKRHGDLTLQVVHDVMLQVDRRDFTHTHLGMPAHVIYADQQIAIGWGQAISAPSLHALVLELVAGHVSQGSRVLDVGMGSGYLTACLSLLVGPSGRVVGVERSPGLAAQAREALQRMYATRQALGMGPDRVLPAVSGSDDAPLSRHEDRVANIRLVAANALQEGVLDGYGQFDVIHVGAAAREVPLPLLHLLKPGGRMVVPVGPPTDLQVLTIIDKHPDGSIVETQERQVKLMPLVPPFADKPQ